MVDTVVNAPPFVPVKPLLKLGTTGSAVEFECSIEELHADVDQDDVTVDTFCGSFTSYKPEKWTITATAYPSYGTTPPGLWNSLRPLVGTSQVFELRPDGVATASPTNPSMTGSGRLKAFPFYAGKLGEPQSIDLEIAVQGAPVWATTLAMVEEAQAEAQKRIDEENASLTTAEAPAESSSSSSSSSSSTVPETPAE